MSKEKKNTIILTVILIVIALCITGVFTFEKLKENGYFASKESKEIMENFNKYYNKKDRTVIYYASSECAWCEKVTPMLETISEDYDMDYYYVDTIKLNSAQKKEVMNKLNIKKHETPITVIVENGKVIDSFIGYTTGQKYVEFFKENELLESDAIYTPEQYITFVDYDKYSNLISEDKTNIIVIGQTTCPHCIAIKPALNYVAKNYEIQINYVNLDDLTDSETDDFFKSLETLGYDDEEFVAKGSIGTPLTIIVKNGKITGYFSGERTSSQLVREFKKLNLIS